MQGFGYKPRGEAGLENNLLRVEGGTLRRSIGKALAWEHKGCVPSGGKNEESI